jgi:hypothetical protein
MVISANVPIAWDGDDWVIVHDWKVRILGDDFTVPAGFQHDRASVPWVLRSLFDRDKLGVAGPAAHDFLYRSGIRTRRQADRVFLAIMRVDGVAPWRRKLAWAAVRAFGWLAYRRG